MYLFFRIAFSIISKRTNNLSKCLYQVPPCSINLQVNPFFSEIRIFPANLILHFEENASETVGLLHHFQPVKWKNAGLSTKQWIQRVLAVTKCSSLNEVLLFGKHDYDVFSVLNIVSKVCCLYIMPHCCNALAKEAVEVLSPVTSSITLFKVPFSNREEFQIFWMGNVECLSIYNDDLSSVQFSLNDLLASNAVKLELTDVPMSLRDLNRFFSCWLNRTSNHRLEHLSVKLLEDINEDVLLERLGATRFTEQRAREYQSTKTFPKFRKFTGGFFRSSNTFTEFIGGFDVRRIDGKLAAITFGNTLTKKLINFDVWP
ncbi:hypothetical protein CRE_10482 [Caenorhabditis remanei]|uniref:Sdz-33 F-box domain-containing protein n=1 Tax=Caenorhabditis remanei TaxID=31234 RepID=E3N0U6_CAERE|nr:hypothetical protein CRE_10482 [Caenorhabditis remanei]